MSEQPNDRIEELQSQLATRDQLQQDLDRAQEAFNREEYRLDTAEIRLQLAQEKIRNLESLTLAGIMSSLLGTKAGEIGGLRLESEAADREHKECIRAIETLRQQIAELTGQIASFAGLEAELQALCPNGAPEQFAETCPQESTVDADSPECRRSIERAIESGESLLDYLKGKYGLYARLCQGPDTYRSSGALFAAGMRAYKTSIAAGVTADIARSVRHFCDHLSRLELQPHESNAEILASLAQLECFANPTGNALDANPDSWAELEVVTRSVISDLQERLAHS